MKDQSPRALASVDNIGIGVTQVSRPRAALMARS